MSKYKILIAEDDADIIAVLRLYLENEQYEVVSAPNGKAAYDIITNEQIDLCIFDIMMPEMSGYELIQKVRQMYHMPILILSAKREDSDRIIGLDIGADDYLTKPFNPLEVVAHVKAAIRRCYQFNDRMVTEEKDLQVGRLRINRQTLQLFKDDEEINVTATELKILLLLMKSPGRVYTKVQICEYVNGTYYENDENTIMVHISNLRDKIEDDPKNPKYLTTVRGLGYKMEDIR